MAKAAGLSSGDERKCRDCLKAQTPHTTAQSQPTTHLPLPDPCVQRALSMLALGLSPTDSLGLPKPAPLPVSHHCRGRGAQSAGPNAQRTTRPLVHKLPNISRQQQQSVDLSVGPWSSQVDSSEAADGAPDVHSHWGPELLPDWPKSLHSCPISPQTPGCCRFCGKAQERPLPWG